MPEKGFKKGVDLSTLTLTERQKELKKLWNSIVIEGGDLVPELKFTPPTEGALGVK